MIYKEYNNITQVDSSLIFVEGLEAPKYNEVVKIFSNLGSLEGQIIDASSNISVIQVFGNMLGLDPKSVRILPKGKPYSIKLNEELIGRIFNGRFYPIDNGPSIIKGEEYDINGYPINPYARETPNSFVETGISVIDGLITLAKGQKLPLFSGSGLPHNKIAVQISCQAKVSDNTLIVFGAMGVNSDEARFLINEFRERGLLRKTVSFINLASDPSIERILLPRIALTTAEYLAYEKGYDVIVILTDITNYCETLREISSAKKEIPGRRGYPGYMYTDLASIFERSGVLKGKKGSITQIPILTMPQDDITHPIPDLTGYVTEGQITLSRRLHKLGIYPPIDILSSISRMMNNAIGKGKTREDHSSLSSQLFASYSEYIEVSRLMELVGEGALSEDDLSLIRFGRKFEKEFINQGFNERRGIENTLNKGWEVLSEIKPERLTRLKQEFINKYGKWSKE
ncbi:MAG: V-type ATP synthase subunit B [Candidatus Rehaiarchaeum fermentans]|nr:V-type ATP synthase subunit B [Candidatus Rehaiarchaeum fermentans]